MGGKSSGKSKTEIRYAGYIETRHSVFLNDVYAARVAAVADNPFTDYENIEVEDAFFGAGYTISSFPSLYDMYGKFMAGLDIEVLWDQVYAETIDSPVVTDLVTAEAVFIEDDIDTNSLPRFQTGMRDMNAVMSSSYVVGRALMEDTRDKLVEKFSADLKYRLIPVAQDRWSTHLNWNKNVVGVYAELMKFYYSAKGDINEQNYSMAVKERLWPFTVLDFERAALGALQGATNQKTDAAGASTASKVLSGALSGAAMGTMVGSQISGTAGSVGVTGGTTAGVGGATATTAGSYSGVGAGIGAVLGIASALTY